MRRVVSAVDLVPPCPKCDAQPGQPCGWKGAVYPGIIHRERKRGWVTPAWTGPDSPQGPVQDG